MTPVAAPIYTFDYRSTGFALIASSVLQLALLACLGIWCGWRPFEPPPSKRLTAVLLGPKLPAQKPAPEAHSAISSSMSAAAEKAARMQQNIDKHIHSFLEQPRPEKPKKPSPPQKPRLRKSVPRIVPPPVRQTVSLPVPPVEKPVKPLPDESQNDRQLSDMLDDIRRRHVGKPSPGAYPETSLGTAPRVQGPQGVPDGSKPASGNEISAYLNLVRRCLEAAKIYPADARRRGLSGTVIIRFRIDAGGTASGQATSGTAPAELHTAALALIRNRRFPAPPKGWNADAFLEIPIRYSLRESGFRY